MICSKSKVTNRERANSYVQLPLEMLDENTKNPMSTFDLRTSKIEQEIVRVRKICSGRRLGHSGLLERL